MPMVKTVNPDGAEIAVKFPYSYPYYFITNMGDGVIHVSGNPGIVPYADGVYTVLPGTEIRISPERSGDTVYLLGSGMVQIRAEEIAVQTSFKLAGKGGDSGGNPEIEQELESLRNDVNSLMNSSGLGRIPVQQAVYFNKRQRPNTWYKVATLSLPTNTSTVFATCGDIFNADTAEKQHCGYYSFSLSGRTYSPPSMVTFLTHDFHDSDGELAALYVPDDNTIEIWYKIGNTNSLGYIYSAITYSMTDYVISNYVGGGFSTLPEYGVQIPAEPLYLNSEEIEI